jgi:hypothetical protein
MLAHLGLLSNARFLEELYNNFTEISSFSKKNAGQGKNLVFKRSP